MAPAAQPMAFISDIHGNLPALEAVLEELKRRTVVDIFVAGDLILGGDAALAVWQRLQAVHAHCVAGPSDVALAQMDSAAIRANDERERQRLLRFAATQKALGEVVRKRLSQLPKQLRLPMIDGSELLLVHGSPKDPFEAIAHEMDESEIRELLDSDPADIVVCGATHVPFARVVDEVLVINVGSVGEATGERFAHFTIVTPKMSGAEFEQSWVEY